MRHLSKTTSLFGIGVIALILAVLTTVAAPNTASAEGPVESRASSTDPGEQCSISIVTRRVDRYPHVFEETIVNGICGTLCTLYQSITVQTLERTICGPEITERLLSSWTRTLNLGSEFDPDTDQSSCDS